MFRTERVIQTKTYQMTLCGLLRQVVVSIKQRIRKRNLASTNLVVTLVVGEEEKPVPPDRPSEGSAKLLADEVGILQTLANCRYRVRAKRVECGRVRGTLESRECGKIVVAEKQETAAMKIIAACPGYDVDRAGRDSSCRKIKANSADL